MSLPFCGRGVYKPSSREKGFTRHPPRGALSVAVTRKKEGHALERVPQCYRMPGACSDDKEIVVAEGGYSGQGGNLHRRSTGETVWIIVQITVVGVVDQAVGGVSGSRQP